MGYSKEQLLSRLQELNITFAQYEHPVVLTVEAQAKHVGNFPGALSKNLFLKDKKQRFYLVSALADTKVDLKVLALRLGVGKGGLRMAPEEALQEVLQVPLGSVTPFALVNESARNVALLLDQGFKNQECCFFHPLSNDMSISLTFRDLDMFLKSIGKDPSYIDLEATPSVGKDRPPDLAALVPPSGSIAPHDLPGKATSIKASSENNVCVENKPVEITANAVKPSNNAQISKDKKATITNPLSCFRDTEHFVEEILGKTSALVLAEVTEETIKQHGGKLAAVVSDKIRKQLSLELQSLTTIFKNTAYTEGFHAAIHRQLKHM